MMTGRKEVAILLIFFHRDRRLFQFVDILENLFERFGVRGPVELSLGNPGDFLQSGLVELNALVLIHDVAEHIGKRLAAFAD